MPWFVAKDVTDILGFKNGSRDVERHVLPAQRQKYRIGTPGGVVAERDVNVISEAGLYRLIMRSNVLGAEQFQDWVTGEVLPTIRKTGGAYIEPGSKAAQCGTARPRWCSLHQPGPDLDRAPKGRR